MTPDAVLEVGRDVLAFVDARADGRRAFRVRSPAAALRISAGAARAGARPVVFRERRGLGRGGCRELARLAAAGTRLIVVLGPRLRGTLETCLDLPGMGVALPADRPATAEVVRACLREGAAACVFEPAGPDLPVPPTPGARVVRSGADLTLFAAGTAVGAALALAVATARARIEVVDLCWLTPLDVALVRESVARTSRGLVVEDRPGTWGSRLALAITEACFADLDAPVHFTTATDRGGLAAAAAALLAW